VPAAAVIREGLVLFIMTRRKAFVGGLIKLFMKENHNKINNTIKLEYCRKN